MTDPRTAFARALRDERLAMSRFEWTDLDTEAQEEWRRRADHIQRILQSFGYEIVRKGEARPTPPHPNQAVISATLAMADTRSERIIQLAGDETWTIAMRNRSTGEVTVEQSFTLEEAMMVNGMVLAGDPEVNKRVGVGRLLAAEAEIYRLNAARMKL